MRPAELPAGARDNDRADTRTNTRARARYGFTLVEVLIALAITALVAAASYSGIATVLNAAEQLRVSAERTRDLERSFALLDRDLRHFVNRPVRDEFDQLQAGLSGGALAPYALSLTRDGWHNSLELPRSDLQRVHYYLEDESLWRAYNTLLEGAVDSGLQRVRLLDGVEALELRFLTRIEDLEIDRELAVDTRNWALSWVMEPGGRRLDPPLAVELRLQLSDLGEIRRIHALPALFP